MIHPQWYVYFVLPNNGRNVSNDQPVQLVTCLLFDEAGLGQHVKAAVPLIGWLSELDPIFLA